MRRLSLLASVAVVAASLASYACGGSDEGKTVTDSPIETPSDQPSGETPSTPPPSSSTSSDPGSPPSTSGGTSGANTSGGASTSGGSSGGASSSGGTSSSGGASSSGGPQTGGSKCIAGSISETEGNDAADTANVLANASGSACGKLTTAADVDYFTFTMPADSNYLGFAGEYTQDGVEFEVSVGDKKFRVGDTPEVRPGSKYTVKVSSKTGKVPADYRFEVQILKK